jgi:hypothetical protein
MAIGEDRGTYVVLGSKNLERGLDDTSSESENEVESGFLLDVWLLVKPSFRSIVRGRPSSILLQSFALLLRPRGASAVLAVRMLSNLRCPLSRNSSITKLDIL